MTFGGLIRVMLRRWYVVAVILVCGALVTALFLRDMGGYTTKTIVTFSQPFSQSLASDAFTQGDDVVAFAGVISTELNHGDPPKWYAYSDAPYYGAGLREGVLVGVPNVAGQWATYYPTAIIEVHIVGRSYDWVADQQEMVLREIERLTSERQGGAPEESQITVTVDPLTTQIRDIWPTRTHQLSAVLAMTAASLIVGAWAAVIVDRIPRARETAKKIKEATA